MLAPKDGVKINIDTLTNRVDKFCYHFQMGYANSSWLLATCSWHDDAN